MQRVISINLNGNAYQIDEAGCDALRDYLDEADRALAGNPDRREIVADLEQAIADKCQAFLGPHKSVVTADEVAQIIKEMGPIETPAGAASATASAPTSASTRRWSVSGSSSRRCSPRARRSSDTSWRCS
jgi:hypothetical protein